MQISIVKYKIFMVLEILYGVYRRRAFRAGRFQLLYFDQAPFLVFHPEAVESVTFDRGGKGMVQVAGNPMPRVASSSMPVITAIMS